MGLMTGFMEEEWVEQTIRLSRVIGSLLKNPRLGPCAAKLLGIKRREELLAKAWLLPSFPVRVK